jgi:hypothetical protein
MVRYGNACSGAREPDVELRHSALLSVIFQLHCTVLLCIKINILMFQIQHSLDPFSPSDRTPSEPFWTLLSGTAERPEPEGFYSETGADWYSFSSPSHYHSITSISCITQFSLVTSTRAGSAFFDLALQSTPGTSVWHAPTLTWMPTYYEAVISSCDSRFQPST